MKMTDLFCMLIGCMLITFSSLNAYGTRRISNDVEQPSRTKDGEHGSSSYLEDGENGEDGEDGKNGQHGGHGGNGGGSVYGIGGNGGDGGDAD